MQAKKLSCCKLHYGALLTQSIRDVFTNHMKRVIFGGKGEGRGGFIFGIWRGRGRGKGKKVNVQGER